MAKDTNAFYMVREGFLLVKFEVILWNHGLKPKAKVLEFRIRFDRDKVINQLIDPLLILRSRSGNRYRGVPSWRNPFIIQEQLFMELFPRLKPGEFNFDIFMGC